MSGKLRIELSRPTRLGPAEAGHFEAEFGFEPGQV